MARQETALSPLGRFDLGYFSRCRRLIGIDEAGRGALAGPVAAAAVCLDPASYASAALRGVCAFVNDSKKMTARRREEAAEHLEVLRRDGILAAARGFAGAGEIARLNILGATRLAMRRALENLSASLPCALPVSARSCGSEPADALLLVDGRPLRPFPYAHEAVVRGDGQSLAIAMASILAKVARDRLMAETHRQYPAYGFAEHKGYGTAGHRRAILEHGPCPVHRSLFLRKILTPRVNREFAFTE